MAITTEISCKRPYSFHFTPNFSPFLEISTGYELDGPEVGVDVQVRARFFSPPRSPDWLLGPPRVPGTPSQGVKWPGRQAHHLPKTNAEVKNTWIYISTPPIRFHGILLS
jgi:hypothetical protein